ncbi:MAG: hypothetical protein NTX50_29570 [Candidatus Sumerlaeota bacterium]|nr:hypothetical protein [Candidatus Sumerlaeota bacterium]
MSEEPLMKWESVTAAIEDGEAKYIGERIEWGRVVRPDGSQVFPDKPGKRSSISFTWREWFKMEDNEFFHTHPSGNSFSDHDLILASEANVSRMITSGINSLGEKHRHILVRPKGGWPSSMEMKRAYSEVFPQARDEMLEKISSDRKMKSRYEADFRHEVIKRLASRFKISYNRERLKE